ncbi:MAG: zinc ribbon domain-containing protein [Candidatus Helarchaeota archaeon]|nr:zinc ribbon domain-containing protein [Candidatus Helarchaeota archaeon]
MSLDTEHLDHETYEKLVSLSESMIERNNVIEILAVIIRKAPLLSRKTVDILTHKFLSKIALLDKHMSRVATDLSCSVCQEKLSLTDPVLICLWCGSPAHEEHLLKHVKTEGYCPACGEYLKFQFTGNVKTISQDLFKTCVNAFSEGIHKLEIKFGEKLLDTAKSREKLQCPDCKRQVSPDWKFCRSCGSRLEHKGIQEVQMKTCPRCGRQITESWRFCKWCGHPSS